MRKGDLFGAGGRSVQLTCSKFEFDHYLRDSFCYKSREQDLGHYHHPIDPSAPTLVFDGKEPGWKKIQEAIRPALSDWHQLKKGIITGCTISVILIALAINMLVKSAEVYKSSQVWCLIATN